MSNKNLVDLDDLKAVSSPAAIRAFEEVLPLLKVLASDVPNIAKNLEAAKSVFDAAESIKNDFKGVNSLDDRVIRAFNDFESKLQIRAQSHAERQANNRTDAAERNLDTAKKEIEQCKKEIEKLKSKLKNERPSLKKRIIKNLYYMFVPVAFLITGYLTFGLLPEIILQFILGLYGY